jgi:hypothetical protein
MTAGYRWVITKDHISEPDENSAVGVQGPFDSDENLKSNPQRFSLYDDDNECYAEGMLYSTDDAYDRHYPADIDFSPLDDYGAPNWGCTAIKHGDKFI